MTDIKDTLYPVAIVGVGPGDPELLTRKAYRLLQEAECVIYDRLIPQDILDLIPKDVEQTYAGKSCRKHHMTQDEINAFLVEQARLGKKVVRLKGGDPFIFGRGGEEALALAEANLQFEIVSGVNAADGCAAVQGIPLTHRGIAHSVRFITGHQQKGEPVALDWKGLADPHTTLVIFMGLANIENIVNELQGHGLDKDTPAAIIQEGTTSKEKKHITSLHQLPQAVESFEPPCIIVIGQVVGLAHQLQPFHSHS